MNYKDLHVNNKNLYLSLNKYHQTGGGHGSFTIKIAAISKDKSSKREYNVPLDFTIKCTIHKNRASATHFESNESKKYDSFKNSVNRYYTELIDGWSKNVKEVLEL